MTAIRHFWIALASGFKAGRKQFRKRLSELAKLRAIAAKSGDWVEP